MMRARSLRLFPDAGLAARGKPGQLGELWAKHARGPDLTHHLFRPPCSGGESRTELPGEARHSATHEDDPVSADGFANGPPPGARADWTIDQGWDAYTDAEHGVWDTLYERQASLLP